MSEERAAYGGVMTGLTERELRPLFVAVLVGQMALLRSMTHLVPEDVRRGLLECAQAVEDLTRQLSA